MSEDEDGHYVNFSAYEALRKAKFQQHQIILDLQNENVALHVHQTALQKENKALSNKIQSLNFDNVGLSTTVMDWQKLYENSKVENAAQASRIAELEQQLAESVKKIGDLRQLRVAISDDGFAATFQSMGKYRTSIINYIDAVIKEQAK